MYSVLDRGLVLSVFGLELLLQAAGIEAMTPVTTITRKNLPMRLPFSRRRSPATHLG
jgi:hypothetical protein